MAQNVTEQLLASHLVDGTLEAGAEVGLRIDQTLTQDATGTLVMLELEAMDLDRAETELSVQYVDHNLIQSDHKNPDDHLFLQSAAARFGLQFSPPGNGVSHPVHQESFGIPGKTLLGSDSHTPAAGALGMLAVGAGGLEVAMAIAGEPFYVKTPEVWGIELTGELPDWVSAKDVILELLRRHGVSGGRGRILEYHGPGLDTLSAWDRHVLANMGTELGATTSVFPSDDEVRGFLERQGRAEAWRRLEPEDAATYDLEESIDLSTIEPLIALPSSPGNVKPVADVAGADIYQAYIGSSANPGPRDFAVPAQMVEDREVHAGVSFDVNPTTRQLFEELTQTGHLYRLVAAGARIHQTGCNGCIGMGQAPASGRRSLRTVPRNFPGRSGTKEDAVYLASPETVTASALTGVITDPRTLEMDPPRYGAPGGRPRPTRFLAPPEPSARPELTKGPNIGGLPAFSEVADRLEGPVLLKVGDDVSTDEIMPAGARVLPFRSNIPAISRFVFDQVDDSFSRRAEERGRKPFFIVGGENYGQGSSREHAALAPFHLGLRSVLAVSFARIHWQNLVNFGIVPLTFGDGSDHGRVDQGDDLVIQGLRAALEKGRTVEVTNATQGTAIEAVHDLSSRQVEVLLSGGLIARYRARSAGG